MGIRLIFQLSIFHLTVTFSAAEPFPWELGSAAAEAELCSPGLSLGSPGLFPEHSALQVPSCRSQQPRWIPDHRGFSFALLGNPPWSILQSALTPREGQNTPSGGGRSCRTWPRHHLWEAPLPRAGAVRSSLSSCLQSRILLPSRA